MGSSHAPGEGMPAEYGAVLWRGEPAPGALFGRQDLFMVPVSAVWFGVSAYIGIRFVEVGAGMPALVMAVIMTLLGAQLLVGRFFVKRARQRRTAYLLTRRFAVIERSGRFEARPLDAEHVVIARHPLSARIDVEFEPPPNARARGFDQYANTGLDGMIRFFNGGWEPFRFYDVADRDGLSAALRAAGVAVRDEG